MLSIEQFQVILDLLASEQSGRHEGEWVLQEMMCAFCFGFSLRLSTFLSKGQLARVRDSRERECEL